MPNCLNQLPLLFTILADIRRLRREAEAADPNDIATLTAISQKANLIVALAAAHGIDIGDDVDTNPVPPAFRRSTEGHHD